jgi:hypothetical protein
MVFISVSIVYDIYMYEELIVDQKNQYIEIRMTCLAHHTRILYSTLSQAFHRRGRGRPGIDCACIHVIKSKYYVKQKWVCIMNIIIMHIHGYT